MGARLRQRHLRRGEPEEIDSRGVDGW